MTGTVFFFWLIVILAQLCLVSPTCKEPFPFEQMKVREVMLKRRIHLYTVNAIDSNVSFTIKPVIGTSRYNFKNHFQMLAFNASQKRIYLIKDIDLDINTREMIDLLDLEGSLRLVVAITCTNNGDRKKVIYIRKLMVEPVDEFAPFFEYEPRFLVPEDTVANSTIGNLRTFVRDKDLIDTTASVDFATVTNYGTLIKLKFPFSVQQHGDVILTTKLDYDIGDRNFVFNVTLLTRNYASKEAVVTVTVININDNPVEFVYDECPENCYPAHYSANLDPSTIGEIKHYTAGRIRARDDDMDEIEYSIVGGSPARYSYYVAMDKLTGFITLLKDVKTAPVSVFDLVIQAKSRTVLAPARSGTVKNEDYTFVLLWIERNVTFVQQRGFSSSAPDYSHRPLHIFISLVLTAAILQIL